MSFTYRVYSTVNNEQSVNNFENQLEVMNYLLQNGIDNVSSIWKVSKQGSLCMYEKQFRSTMKSETYYTNYTMLSQYDIYNVDDGDKQIMSLCD